MSTLTARQARQAAFKAQLAAARKRNRKNTVLGVLSGTALAVGVLALLALVIFSGASLWGWLVMLVLGGLHSGAWRKAPLLSFWQCLPIGFAIVLVSSILRSIFRTNS